MDYVRVDTAALDRLPFEDRFREAKKISLQAKHLQEVYRGRVVVEMLASSTAVKVAETLGISTSRVTQLKKVYVKHLEEQEGDA